MRERICVIKRVAIGFNCALPICSLERSFVAKSVVGLILNVSTEPNSTGNGAGSVEARNLMPTPVPATLS